MARSQPGCVKVFFGLILVIIGTLAGGQVFFVGLETMALATSALGVSDPILGWALVGGILGALAGVLVGLRRAGRRRMFWIKIGAIAVVVGLVLLGVERAGAVIDQEIRAPVLFSSTVGTERLNVRPAPTRENTPLATILEGTPVDVLEQRPGWLRVRYRQDGRRATGWVSRRYVASPSDVIYDAGTVSFETGRVEGQENRISLPVLVDGVDGFLDRLDYPAVARAADIRGEVLVEAVIDEQGRVETATASRSPSEVLTIAALKAVRDTRFRPARRAGLPVRVRLTIPVPFGR